MNAQVKKIFFQALNLSPTDRADLIEQFFQSFIVKERKEIDAVWSEEAKNEKRETIFRN